MALAADAKQLSEVVVTGYGPQRLRQLLTTGCVKAQAAKLRRPPPMQLPGQASPLQGRMAEPGHHRQGRCPPCPPARKPAPATPTPTSRKTRFSTRKKDPLSTFALDVDNASLHQRAPLPQRRPAAPARRRAGGGNAELLPLRLRRAGRHLARPRAHQHRAGRLPLERRPPAGPHRHSGQEDRNRQAAARQPGVPGRCVGLDVWTTTSCRWCKPA